MKLMYFLPLLSTAGGQERTIIDKANWLVEKGHEVLLVTFENDGGVAYSLQKKVRHVDLVCPYFRIYRFPFVCRFYAALKIKRLFRHKMKETLNAFQPDVVVVTIPLTEFFCHDLLNVIGNIPIVVESHLACGHEAITRGITEKLIDFFIPPMDAIRKSDLLVALTEGDACLWRKYHHKVCVIPNPLTCYPEDSPHIEQAKGRIICVGRLSPQKRFDRLINAFAMIAEKYPNWCVDIFGEGQGHGQLELKQLITERSLERRVRICSPVRDIYSEYRHSDFLVLSSDFEGFGLVIIEAMACGIPVVATDCPFGPSEIVDDGKSGLLAKMDVKDLAEKMEWMITHDKERKLMGLNAHQAAAYYRKEIIMPQWEEAYLSVIQS